jgi:hypothetical protein
MTDETSIAKTIEQESDSVRDGDVILIDTANHTYQLEVIDSCARVGLLSGGALGERKFGVSVGSLLEEGYAAEFVIRLAGSVCRMVTSDVTDLVFIRDGQKAPRKAVRFPSLNVEEGCYAA